MTPRRNAISTYQEQLSGILDEKVEHIVSALARIETRLEQIDERLRAAELTAARGEAALNAAQRHAEQAHTRLDEQQNRLEAYLPPAEMRSLAEKVAQMEAPVRAMIWLGGALGVSLVGLLWAIFTHQVTLLIP